MSDVTIRELNRQTKAILARATAGESLRIVNAGRPIAVLGPLSDATVARKRAKAEPEPDGEPCPADPLGQLRWLQAAQLRAVACATDERTRTGAAKEARALTERIGKLTGELREAEDGDLARYERMTPEELLEAVLEMAQQIREVIDG